jgi:heme exporter protein D
MLLFAAGAALGLIGVMQGGRGWWVPSAIALLAVGMLLSLVQSVARRRDARRLDEEEEEGEEGEEGVREG